MFQMTFRRYCHSAACKRAAHSQSCLKKVDSCANDANTLYMGHRMPGAPSLIDFKSVEGRALLISCLSSENAGNKYLSLSEQFLTQSSPPSCGMATLAMLLNSLRVDPGRVWQKPWRWFTEEMLTSCYPNTGNTAGITMEHFGHIAECNGAAVQTFYGEEVTANEFRNALVHAFDSSEEMRIAVAFDRQVLGQTGTGHYSPIGAYNREADMILVLDVARFKYPPYWVPVELMWKAMSTHDPDTLKSRGFFILTPPPSIPERKSSS